MSVLHYKWLCYNENMSKNLVKSKNKRSDKKGSFNKTIAWIIALGILLVVSVAMNVVLLMGCGRIGIENKKLQVFDDLAFNYIMEHDLTDNGGSELYQMTGYGISDEDDVFYVTFKYADYSECESADCDVETQYGVMYFWPGDDGGTGYSHAYSYHSEPYHPEGEYVERELR